MNKNTISRLLFYFLILFSFPVDAQLKKKSEGNTISYKPRILVLTDVSTWETDDSESLVRLFAHADMFEIEGLVYTTGWSLEETRDDFFSLIHDAIDAYEKDLPNLFKRSSQSGNFSNEGRQGVGYWPSPGYLRARTMYGSKKRGIEFIGEGNDSPGSEMIIKLADEDDGRPLWVLAWGGANTLAQANHKSPASAVSGKYSEYFYEATFNNFAARMDWAKDGRGNRNPVVVINHSRGIDVLMINRQQGRSFKLDASKSFDWDGDKFTFRWWVLPEAGTYEGEVVILNHSSSCATVKIPPDSADKCFHVICEVTDKGTPNLTNYRRIIFEPAK